MCLIVFLNIGIQSAQAQITINEKMELQEKSKNNTESHQEDDVKALVGSLPKRSVLYPLGDGEYLVLRTGRLKLSIGEAVLYDPQTNKRTQLTMQRKQAATETQIQRNIDSGLLSPIIIEADGEKIMFYRTSVDFNKSAVADTYVDGKNRSKNHGDDQLINVRSYNPKNESKINNGRNGLISFGFNGFNIQQNGTLQRAKLQLQPPVRSIKYGYPGFTVYKAMGSWREMDADWLNRPSAGGGGIEVTENDLKHVRYIGPEDSLKTGIYNIDVKNYVRDWLGSQGSSGVLLKQPYPGYGEPSFISVEGALVNIGVAAPGVSITISNSRPEVPDQRIVDFGHVEAGDVLAFNFNGFQNYLRNSSGDGQIRQKLRFSQNDSAYTEFLEAEVLMEEDTTRRPYITMDLQADTSTVASGDTVALHPKVEFDNGIKQPFSYRQRFTTGIIRRRQAGTLLNVEKKDTADFFKGLETPWAFIANDSLSIDSVETAIHAKTYFRIGEDVSPASTNLGTSPDTDNPKPSVLDSNAPPIIFPSGGPLFSKLVQDSLQLTVKKDTAGKILLGQTKYYYAVEDPNDSASCCLNPPIPNLTKSRPPPPGLFPEPLGVIPSRWSRAERAEYTGNASTRKSAMMAS